MLKILFVPVGIAGSFVAAFAGKAVFTKIWGIIDKEEPPDPKHRAVSWTKLLVAAGIEGAIFRIIRAGFDHGTRTAVANVTGSWPGEEAPEARP